MVFPNYEGHSRQFRTMSDTACMSGRGRDNSGNETRAGAGGQWHGNCDDYYECGHEKYDDRVTPVKCHHSQPGRHRRHPHHILWLEPDYLQLTSKYKLKCSNCTSKLLVPAHTYLVVMFLATHCLINSLSRYLGFMLDCCCILCRHSVILGGLLLLLLVSGYRWFRATLHSARQIQSRNRYTE